MENYARANVESADSMPEQNCESLPDAEMSDSTNRTVAKADSYSVFVEPQKDIELSDSDHDIEKERLTQDQGTEENDQHINEEDISLEYEEDEEEDLCEDYLQDGSESCVEPITSDSKNDALIVQGNDGMIKKIKICHTAKDVNEKNENKSKKSLNSTQTEGNHTKLLPRSSTPMSREYLALQRSVNESKILTEFVSDAAGENTRKLRAKDSTSSVTSSNVDHSYSTIKKASPEKASTDDSYNGVSPSQGKRQYSRRYVPLKDSDSDVDSSTNLRPRSRSKSMHNSELNLSSSTHKKLKKWPSEERLHKRTNMRSENSEFAQKQAEFLQRVIHACENPRRRSRSRSCGRKTPNSLNEQSIDGSGGSSGHQQQKTYKTSNKERYSKRHKYDMGSENDEPLLGENNSEQPDEEYINESQPSLVISSPADSSLADNKEVEAHLKSVWQPSPKPGYDSFCWKCHENKVNLCCYKCIRSFHAACVKISKFDNIWLCPECTTVENLLNNPKRSRRNELSLDLLSQLLSFALKRMRYTKGHYNFVMPYEDSSVYKKYIANPVSLSGLQTKIEAKEFRCAEEFVNETKWMLHNAYILSSRNNTKIVLAAKSIFKICRQEANEIETCAECYLNANTRTDWFVDVCSQPHLLLWAKLKGFPYWPAKAMGPGQNSLINVRFFGEHDRAFVPLKDCFLYSEQDPNTATGKRAARELADCIKEVEEHIEKIKTKVGGFKYAPFKTPYEPADELKQLAEMMPGVLDFIKRQQGLIIKPSLQFKIYKTADNNLSIVQKASSTPELNCSQSLENDDKEKKKKLSSEGNDAKKADDIVTLPAKYEVVSKVASDDSNSSKLSTVILKRKSVNGDSKKVNGDETVDLPMPKMTKIEDQLMEDDFIRLATKRKIDNQSLEKSKTKHSKLEMKIPIITIKTSAAKDLAENSNKEENSQIIIVSNPKEDESVKQLPDTQQSLANETNEKAGDSQKVVENLVKHKQGVTIKKIARDSSNEQQGASRTSKENSKDKKESKGNTEEEKARENLKVNNILKGLVPFVEVKKEVLSDNEEDTGKQHDERCTYAETETSAAESTKEITQKGGKNLTNISPPETNPCENNNDKTDNNDTEKEKPTDSANCSEVIAQVKQEVLSEEDETNENVHSNAADNQIGKKTLKIKISDIGMNVERPSSNSPTIDVRVVGDTTIQKLPNKNNTGHYFVYSTNSSNNNISSGSSTSNSNNLGTFSKRTALKGVPYGPLPASAFPKASTNKAFQLTDAQPRAKKSFPQHSPPVEKFRQNNNQNTIMQMSPPTTTTQHLEQKRAIAKNTMVTIPVDMAINRTSTSSGTIIIGSIPVPPLTAVSKTMPSSLALNTTARNSPASGSSTASGSTIASHVIQAKSTTTMAANTSSLVRNSPITVTSSSSTLAPLISTATSTSTSTPSLSLPPSTPVTTTNTSILNPLSMTTPPPLAGLSNSCLVGAAQASGTLDPNNATVISTMPTIQQPSTETHILGGLVTPTLASAITDIICRGPPKLAARPKGPLQSEGYPIYPSPAGPVCKRLVENVHKLTDFFISVVEDTMGEMALGDDPSLQAKITLLTIELERSKQAYEQEIAELKRTSDLMLCEMRKSMENEKTRLVVEIRKQCEMERLRSVEETKRKQWCANCFREANFYCCWNTSYCDYPCQQLHWSRHSHSCAQTRSNVNETTSSTTTTTQTERHHINKSNSTITLSSTTNFNKSATISQKKEKGITKNTTNNHIMSSSLAAVATPSASRPEVLKLPTNTYLRPVASNLNSQTLRCNTTYSLPLQRFSAPITTPANSSSPQTFTIVQQGNSWVMSTTTNNNNNSSSSATNSSTLTAQNASLTQIAGQPRPGTGPGSGTVITNKSAKTQIRYH